MITPEAVQKAIRLIHASPANAAYFFEQLKSPEWIGPLDANHLFSSPYSAVPRGDLISFPVWTPGEYLARMSVFPEAQERIVTILEKTPQSDNPRVYEAVADSANALEPSLAERLVPQLEIGLQLRFQLLLPDKVGKTIRRLCAAGRGPSALRLAKPLFEILAPGDDQSEASRRFGRGVRTRVDAWEFGQLMRTTVAPLTEACGVGALEWLCGLLRMAVAGERIPHSDETEDYSYVWRPSIEHTAAHRDGVRGELVTAVRDAAAIVAHARGLSVALDLLGRQPGSIFTRLGLHVIAISAEAAPPLRAEWLRIPKRSEDGGLDPEYDLALEASWGVLPASDRERYLNWVRAGPDLEGYARRRVKWDGTAPSEGEVDDYANRWRRDHWHPIREALQEADGAEYARLVETLGQPISREDFTEAWSGWLGENSPLPEDEARAMSWDTFIGYVKGWVPTQVGIGAASREGLAGSLRSRVALDPAGVTPYFGEIAELPLRYIASVFEALRDALRDRRAFDWAAVIGFAERCATLAAPQEQDDGQPDRRWVRESLVSLLEDAFDADGLSVEQSHRGRVWALIAWLAEDPDPTPESERDWESRGMDAATLGLNSIRGQAMHAAVRYGLWFRRHEMGEESGASPTPILPQMPELRQLLERHLDSEHEPSPGVRAVYGQWFPWLTLLDKEWAKGSAPRIFGGTSQLSRAAWDTYIVYCRPYSDVFPLLRQYYEVAVRLLALEKERPTGRGEPESKLAQHLMSFYWRGQIDRIDGGLLELFFDLAPTKLRAQALDFVGDSLLRADEPPSTEIARRLMALWDWRIANAAVTQEEVQTFGGWFGSGRLDTAWSVARLQAILEKKIRPEPDHSVAERLVVVADTDVVLALSLLEQLIQVTVKDWSIYGWVDECRAILKKGLTSGNAAARATAERVANEMVRYRFKGFRELLKEG